MLYDPNPTMALDSAPITQLRERPAPVARLVSWLPWHQRNTSLCGHATITFNAGWTIHAIPIFRSRDGGLSAGGPTRPVVGGDGVQKTDAAGEKTIRPVITFEGDGQAFGPGRSLPPCPPPASIPIRRPDNSHCSSTDR